MTRTVFYTATTLDGYLADEQDSLEWLFRQDSDPEGPYRYDEFIAGIGAVVMGRTTYEWVRAHLHASGEDWPYAMPTWVVTHAQLPGIPGADLRFAQGRWHRSTPPSRTPPVRRTSGSSAAGTWRPSSPRPDCWTGWWSPSHRSPSGPAGPCSPAGSTWS